MAVVVFETIALNATRNITACKGMLQTNGVCRLNNDVGKQLHIQHLNKIERLVLAQQYVSDK